MSADGKRRDRPGHVLSIAGGIVPAMKSPDTLARIRSHLLALQQAAGAPDGTTTDLAGGKSASSA